MCYLSSDSWQEWKDKISEILSDSNVMNKLIKNEELCGHLQPGGKITFNQTLNEKSFAQFTKVINDIVPFDVVISGDPIISLADVLDETEVNVYTNYININATLDEYDELDL